MVLNIEQDYLRFRQIVRGKIKQDLKKYISQGELIGKKGKDYVSIPIPQIEMPNFRFGRRNTGGVGQGEGEPGTPLAPGDVDEDGNGQRAMLRAPTSSKSISRWRNSPRFLPRNWNCRASSPRAARV